MPYDPTQPIVDLDDTNEVPDPYDDAVYKIVEEYLYDGNTRQKRTRLVAYTAEELEAQRLAVNTEAQALVDDKVIELKLKSMSEG